MQPGSKFKVVQADIGDAINSESQKNNTNDRPASRNSCKYARNKVHKVKADKNVYIYFDFSKSGNQPDPPTEGVTIENIEDYIVHDTPSDSTDIVIYDNNDKGIVVG